MSNGFEYIDSNAALAALCERAATLPMLALDTEFVREDTYFPKPALLQLNAGGDIYLIDPLKIDQFAAFQALLADPGIAKVMHSCSEDMEVFNKLMGDYPANLFDTQIAAALCGHGFSLGYQKLVAQLLDEHLEKTETRSKWLQRPLTDRQCHYAVDDVRWLPHLYDILQQQLHELSRKEWCSEECDRVLAQARQGIADEDQYLRLRAASRLSPEARGRLRALCAWREKLAREHNVPKGRIVSDATLLDIVERIPTSLRELGSAAKIRQSSVRRFGDSLLACLASTDCQPLPGELPGVAERGDKSRRELVRKMQAQTRDVAEAIGLPVEILGKKRDLEQFIEAREQSPIANGWRAPLLADKLDALCKC
ncbi:MAG: ribonuclease D [Gammaproteobacteria bacterium]|nr:ribonuclease D [Gammaproteobacteria bacterium]MBT8151019.1 ribonuclease D [Gammaproteobacteria bacterium]NND38822.1 ribonuclease D [Pseudomonadales bacterium]NNM12164.1 ribonuclease D [Pseudomonadales bacterium]